VGNRVGPSTTTSGSLQQNALEGYDLLQEYNL
jgi:hypothetical protein